MTQLIIITPVEYLKKLDASFDTRGYSFYFDYKSQNVI